MPYAPLKNNSLALLEQAALNYLIDLAKSQGKRFKFIDRKGELKSRFKETTELLNDSDVDLIINPLFIYQGANTNLLAYDKTTQALIVFLPSFSTKRNNLLSIY